MLDIDTLLKKTFLEHVEHHAVLSSTNDRGRDCPVGPGETPRLIVADAQTAGRGRGQTSWWTGAHSLPFSIVLEGRSLQTDPQRRLMISLVAGIAVTEAVSSLFDKSSSLEVGLHWPNDVFVDGRKLCGILVEVARDGRIVVGIGINTNDRLSDAPAELSERVTTLRDLTGCECDHTDLLVRILNRFEQWQTAMMDDPTEVGRRADELCLQHGEQLAIDQGDGRIISGRCLGLASDGAIRLDTSHGPCLIYSGRLVSCKAQ